MQQPQPQSAWSAAAPASHSSLSAAESSSSAECVALRAQLSEQAAIVRSQAAAIDDAREATVAAVRHMQRRTADHMREQEQYEREIVDAHAQHQRDLAGMELAHALVVAGLQHDLLTLQQRLLQCSVSTSPTAAASTPVSTVIHAGTCTHSCAQHSSASDRHELLVMLEAQSEALERLTRAHKAAPSTSLPAVDSIPDTTPSATPVFSPARSAAPNIPTSASTTQPSGDLAELERAELIAALERETMLQAELTALQAEVRLMADIAQEEQAALERAQQEVIELSSVRDELATAREELATVIHEYDALEAQLRSSQADAAELQTKLDVATKSVASSVAESETMAQQALAQIAGLESELEAARSDLEAVSSDLETARTDLEHAIADRRVASQQEVSERALELAHSLETASREANREMQVLESAHLSEVAHLHQTIHERDAAAESLQQQLAELTEARGRQERDSDDAQLVTLNAALAAAARQQQRQQEEVQRLTHKLRDAEEATRSTQLNSQLQRSTQEVQRLTRSLQETELETKRHRDKFEALATEHALCATKPPPQSDASVALASTAVAIPSSPTFTPSSPTTIPSSSPVPTILSPLAASSLLDFLLIVGRCKTEKRTGWVNERVRLPESVADHMFRMALMALTCVDYTALPPRAIGSTGDLSTPQPDTVADRIDPIRALQMALVHDLAEALVGDITPPQFSGVTKEDKHRLEREAMDTICETLRRAHHTIPRATPNKGRPTRRANPLGDSDAESISITSGEKAKPAAEPSRPSIFSHSTACPVADHIYALYLEYEGGATATAKYVKNLDKLDMFVQAYEYQLAAQQDEPQPRPTDGVNSEDAPIGDSPSLIARLDRFFAGVSETQAKIASQDVVAATANQNQPQPQRLLHAVIDELQNRRAKLQEQEQARHGWAIASPGCEHAVPPSSPPTNGTQHQEGRRLITKLELS